MCNTVKWLATGAIGERGSIILRHYAGGISIHPPCVLFPFRFHEVFVLVLFRMFVSANIVAGIDHNSVLGIVLELACN